MPALEMKHIPGTEVHFDGLNSVLFQNFGQGVNFCQQRLSDTARITNDQFLMD